MKHPVKINRALGILFYELLCGHTPFEGRNQQRTFEKIVQSGKYLGFPKNFDAHAKSMVKIIHIIANLVNVIFKLF